MNRINRINYIVQENPKGVADALLAAGIKPSSNREVLTKQTKAWIQKEGKAAVIKLLQVHPEKKAILSANQSGFDNYGSCGCKSSFDGSACGCKSSFDGSTCPCNSKSSYSKEDLKELEAMNEKELRQHYKDLKNLLKQFPDDEELRKEVEMVWQFIRSNNKQSKEKTVEKDSQMERPRGRKGRQSPSKEVFSVTSKDLAVGSFIFGIALIISQIR